MRLVLFGSGSPASAAALDAVAGHHDVRGVVVPGRSGGDWRSRLWRRFRPSSLDKVLQSRKIPAIEWDKSLSVVSFLEREDPELMVVATFPAILPAEVLRWPAVNIHPSLLPRHRGPHPLFWSYYDDDRETGISVHWMTERVDAGNIISRTTLAIDRGEPIDHLYMRLTSLGADRLIHDLDRIARGSVAGEAQDETMATREPSPVTTAWTLPFDKWPVERTWHFIAGVAPTYGRFCRDSRGEPLSLRGAAGFEIVSGRGVPGSIERKKDFVRLHGPDGFVDALV